MPLPLIYLELLPGLISLVRFLSSFKPQGHCEGFLDSELLHASTQFCSLQTKSWPKSIKVKLGVSYRQIALEPTILDTVLDANSTTVAMLFFGPLG